MAGAKNGIFRRISFFSILLWSCAAVAQRPQLIIHDHTPEDGAPAGSIVVPAGGVMVPAGSRVLMTLTSPLHTTSAAPGSGIYLETSFPVIVNNRVVIPAHTQVLGVVETDTRPGHLNRTAQFRFRFTTLIFSNASTIVMDGVLQDLPGSGVTRVHDEEGTLETVDQAEKTIPKVVGGGLIGGLIGSATGSRFGIGKTGGAVLGASLGSGGVLLTRGNEIRLPQGTPVEMALRAPLILSEDQIKNVTREVSSPQPPATTIPGTRPPNGIVEPRRRPPNPLSRGPLWPLS